MRVGGEAVGDRQTELAPHDIGALHQRDDLVEGVTPAHAFTPHAAIGADDQPFDRDVLERAANVIGDLLRAQCLIVG